MDVPQSKATQPMTNGGKAFAKGGIGCLVGFVVLAVAVGGSVHLNLGGVLGLIVNWIYQKGRRDAEDDDECSPPTRRMSQWVIQRVSSLSFHPHGEPVAPLLDFFVLHP